MRARLRFGMFFFFIPNLIFASLCSVSLKRLNDASNPALRTIQFLAVGDALITGSGFYPVEHILSNLGLGRDLADLKGNSVVSVGEGYSGLLPYLRNEGIRAVAVDPAYPKEGQSFEDFEREIPQGRSFAARQRGPFLDFVQKNQKDLKNGTMDKIPLGDKSVDILLSHKVVNNGFTVQDGIRFIEEGLRVARKELRINGFTKEQIALIKKYFEKKYPEKYSLDAVSIFERASLNQGRESHERSELLIVRPL